MEEEDLDTSGLFIGPTAEHYLRQFATRQEVDKTFGLYDKAWKFYIGNTPVEIVDKEYLGSTGLWELLIVREPDTSLFTVKRQGRLRRDSGKDQCNETR